MKRLLILLVLAFANTAVADDYVLILLDTSGSTGEYMRSAKRSRLDVAKTALVDVLSKIPDTTKVGLLTFNGWVCDLQPVNRLELQQQIAGMRSSGSTPLYQHMKMAADRLLQEREKQANIGSYKLLIITDGEATDSDVMGTFADGSPRPSILTDILSRNLMVDVIGLDMKSDHTLETQINGNYMRGDDPTSLSQAVIKAVAEVGFGTTKDVSDEAFADIKELPEPMVVAIIQGITSFPNHPICEKPYVKVVMEDGTIVMQPAPGETPVNTGVSEWKVFLWIIAIIFCVAFVVFIAAATLKERY